MDDGIAEEVRPIDRAPVLDADFARRGGCCCCVKIVLLITSTDGFLLADCDRDRMLERVTDRARPRRRVSTATAVPSSSSFIL